MKKPPAARPERRIAPAGGAGKDERFMRLALHEAYEGLGRTSPNPPVGAVLVKKGRVIGLGHHQQAGGPHAEIHALREAGSKARGADLYVTLEPCAHHGRTPPCAPAVAEAGVARVIVGSLDPNPLVAGKGIRIIERAGIPVVLGVLRPETDRLIEGWTRFITTGRPHVIAKVAATLDGRIATRTGDSKWITSEGARALVHRLRDRVDAVLVGRGTVEADDPQLTTRIPDGHDPVRVVLDSKLRVKPTARIFHTGSPAPTLVACVGPAPRRAKALREVGAEIVECEGRGGRVDLSDLLGKLAARGIVQLLVEGGSRVYGAFLEERLVDELHLHMGPKIFGGGPSWTDAPAADRVADALGFTIRAASIVGGDLVVEARPAQARQEAPQPTGRRRRRLE